MSDVNTETSPSEVVVDNTTNVTAEGTSSAEMSNTDKVSESVPYSRFQEKVEEANQLKAQLEAASQQQSYQQPVQQNYQQGYQPTYQPTYQQQQLDPLVEQFGYEGAQAVKQGVMQPLLQQLFTSEYTREYEKGQAAHGNDWQKFDYIDHQGMKQNKIMDLRIKGLDMNQAWNAMNPINVDDIKQKIKDETYQEMNKKEAATPVNASNVSPGSTGTGHATSTEEAYKQALAELSRG